MSSTLAANIFVSGDMKILGNVQTNNSFQYLNPEVLAASGAMSPYRPSVLKPSAGSFAEISTSPGVGQVTSAVAAV